jgi:hypothetical protein
MRESKHAIIIISASACNFWFQRSFVLGSTPPPFPLSPSLRYLICRSDERTHGEESLKYAYPKKRWYQTAAKRATR